MATFGAAPGILISAAVGAAASTALEPAFELPRQSAWAANPNRVLDASLMARLVAQGAVTLEAAHSSGSREGLTADKVDALVYLSQTVPGVPEALRLWRRGHIDDALWTHALVKAGLDPRYAGPLGAEKIAEPLSPADVAYAVVRGLVPDDGILPVPPPTSGTTIQRFPIFPIDPVAEAAKSGFDRDRFSVLVGRSGLSIAPGMAAQAYFRDAINLQDFYLAVAEGDLRNEWRDTILAASRAILTPAEAVNLRLRGWIENPEMYRLTGLHGMSQADTDYLFLGQGRPITPHQVFIGERRGGVYNGPTDQIAPAYLKALQEGNQRPEWYNLAWAGRYAYPSTFILRSMTQAGDLTAAETEQILLYEAWEPALAHTVSTRWASSAGGTTAHADPWVKRAQTQLWTAAHRAYVVSDASEIQARGDLGALGVTTAAQDQIIALWNAERALVRRDLAATDIRKELRATLITEAEAITRLLELGYSAAEATTYLELSPSGP